MPSSSKSRRLTQAPARRNPQASIPLAPAAEAVRSRRALADLGPKEYKDLPALLPKQQDSGVEAGIGLLEFVCMKSNYFVLLVQPSVKLRDSEPGMISARAANTASGSAPVPLTFRNLYKTKSVLSRSLNWDADIHYAEITPAAGRSRPGSWT
jgi:hypothetical protein